MTTGLTSEHLHPVDVFHEEGILQISGQVNKKERVLDRFLLCHKVLACQEP